MEIKDMRNVVDMALAESDFEDGGLTAKQSRFVQEYPVDFNGSAAAIRAGYSEATAYEIASALLSKLKIRSAIQRRVRELAAVAQVDGARVIAELAELAFADPRELISVHQGCCRHCHGFEFQRQWRITEYSAELDKALAAGSPAPEMLGGFGFDSRKSPHPDCPNCDGIGVATTNVTDSRKLSRGAARLLASVRQTKDGCIELKTHDQQAALMALGKITGVLRDRQELSGPNGGAIQLQPVAPERDLNTMTNDELREALLKAGYGPGGGPRLIEATIGGNNEP
jgi:phage terminase small subunit